MILDNIGGAGDRITSAIQAASRSTGTAFDYLLRTASRESAFNPSAKASTSSARGLFQFIESTWLGMVKEEGANYGLGRQAAAIEKTGQGKYVVRDPAMRSAILQLRDDPKLSAIMAGALANRNSAALSETLGRKPTSGELYIAHFLGLNGAKKLISLQQGQSTAAAASAFPEAAKANRSIFYDRRGRAKSAGAVYASLVGKHDSIPQMRAPAVQVAFAGKMRTDPPVQPTRVHAVQVQLPDLESDKSTAAALANDGPMFQTMFRTQHSGPISDAVREIWGRRDPAAAERRRYFPSNTNEVSGVQQSSIGNEMPGADRTKPS